ncbi:hypothetical protein PV-S19_0394 [Pacmanvirus S19]|nr:hypothetical protein PV-S19_0394 [Pacmanvirus S19]
MADTAIDALPHIDALPVEIIGKIINPFSGITHLVCKLWDKIASDLYIRLFNKHKKQFAATLTEINSIVYNCAYHGERESVVTNYRIPKEKYLKENKVDSDDENIFGDGYFYYGQHYSRAVYDSNGDFCGEFYQITVASIMRKSISTRRYENKVACYVYELNLPIHYPVKNISIKSNDIEDKYTLSVNTYCYLIDNESSEIYTNEQIHELLEDSPVIKYDTIFSHNTYDLHYSKSICLIDTENKQYSDYDSEYDENSDYAGEYNSESDSGDSDYNSEYDESSDYEEDNSEN